MQSIGPVIIQAIFYILCGLLVSYAGIQSYNYYKEKIKDHKAMWHFALTTFICVTLSFATAVFFIPLITFNHKMNLCPSFLITQVFLSSIFKINLYLFFLQRVHNTFQFSIHEIHPCLINILRIIIVTYWTTVTIVQCALIYPESEISNINGIYFCDLSNSAQIKMDILFICDCIAESILCPLMLLLFIRGLYNVVSTRKNLSVRESITSSNSVAENMKNNSLNVSSSNGSGRRSKSFNDQQRNSMTFDGTLSPSNASNSTITSGHTRRHSETISEDGYDYNNKSDRNFVYAMTKFTTLANISFITSLLVYILLLICKYFSTDSYALSGLQIGIRLVFDQMINCFCVYFVFRFTDNKYHRYCFIAHQIQIQCMISLCPKTKPMFEVAKLEYQRNYLGMKRYASHVGLPKNKVNQTNDSKSTSASVVQKKSQCKNSNNNSSHVSSKLNESINLPPVPENKCTLKIQSTEQKMKELMENRIEETEIDMHMNEIETIQIYCDGDEILHSQASI